jgi:2-oxoglutarate ferredoxin oxidoreductase subunit alpha
VLYPSSVYECFDLTIKAVNFSESYRLPVTLLLDEVIAHMREKVSLPPEDKIEVREREKPATPPEWYKPYEDTSTGVPPMASFGEGYRYHITGLTHDVMGFPTSRPDEAGPLLARLKRKITSAVRQVTLFEEFHMEDAEIAIIAYGCVARTAKDVVLRARAKGNKVGLFKPLTVWPFPKLQINELSKRVKGILVPELNQGQMVYEVERTCAGRCKVLRLQKYNGQIFSPKEILDKIEEMVT